jgi:hypothetical protein
MAVLAPTAIVDHTSERGITRPLTTMERRVLVIAGVAIVLVAGVPSRSSSSARRRFSSVLPHHS